LQITLNGDSYEVAGPLTVTDLLARLDIDARRVAVELNLVVLKRDAFERTTVQAGDEVEIVNFVGGG
jgi:thiamine biosynthesis protein ThiS